MDISVSCVHRYILSTQALIQDFVREGGWLAPKIFRGAQRTVPREMFGALLGGSGMLPQKIFKIESARLA